MSAAARRSIVAGVLAMALGTGTALAAQEREGAGSAAVGKGLVDQVGGVSYVTATTLNPGNTQTPFGLTCPAGTHSVGGGALGTLHGSQRIVSSFPADDGSDSDTLPDDGWSATMDNVSGTPASVSVATICLKRGAKSKRASGTGARARIHYVTGHKRENPFNVTSSDTLSCPGKTKLISPGILGAADLGKQTAERIAPKHQRRKAKGRIHNGGGGLPYDFRVFAVCDRGHYQLKEKTAAVALNGQEAVTVSCKPGKHVLGGGFSAANSAEPAYMYTDASYPVDGADADSVPDDGWHVSTYAYLAPGTIKGYAVCR